MVASLLFLGKDNSIHSVFGRSKIRRFPMRLSFQPAQAKVERHKHNPTNTIS